MFMAQREMVSRQFHGTEMYESYIYNRFINELKSMPSAAGEDERRKIEGKKSQ